MDKLTWTTEQRRVGDLVPWPRNPRQIQRDQAERLVESFDQFGQVETLAVGPNAEVYNGHQRINVLLDKYGPDYLVDVRVASRALMEKEREKLTVFLHRGTTGDWNWDLLANEFEMEELLEWGFEEAELLGQGFGKAELPEDAGPQLDKAAELQEKWGTNLGQVWQLDEHCLAVGDCTDRAVVEAVMRGDSPFIMVTDPPYGVEYDPSWRDGVVGEFGAGAREKNAVIGDDHRDWSQALALFRGDVAYIWCASWFISDVGQSLRNLDFQLRYLLIWRKRHFAISHGDYHWQHEPCWYAVRNGKRSRWCGDRTQSTVWDIASLNPAGRQEERFPHAAQKPLECMARPIRNHGTSGDVIYDPFLGSGTTMVAAERLGRRCRGIEISPAYCAVAIQRWVDLTGREPALLEE